MQTQIPFSSRFATSVEDLVRAACIEEGATPIQLGKESLEELKALSESTREMKESFDSQLTKCNQNVAGAERHISVMMKDLSEVKAATDELVNVSRELDSVTPIRLGEQNLEELKTLSSDTSVMKSSFNEKLDKCNQSMTDATNEISSMRKDIEDVKGVAVQLVDAEEQLRTTRDQDGAISVRFGTQNVELLKELSESSKEMKDVFEQKLDICNQDMSDAKKDINEVKNDISEVKSATNILVKVAHDDDGATSIRLGLQTLEALRTLNSGSTAMQEMINNQLQQCNQSVIDAKQVIADVKNSTKALVRRAGLSNNQASEFGDDCIDKLKALTSDTKTMKESFDSKLDTYSQDMSNAMRDICEARRGVTDMKKTTNELVKVSHVNDVAISIRLGEQNLGTLKELTSDSTLMKDFIDERLNTCNKTMVDTTKDISDVKKDIIGVKNTTNELVKIVCSHESAKTSSLREQKSLDVELRKLVSGAAKINDSFSAQLSTCNQNMSDVMNEMSKVKKQVNDTKTTTEQLVETVAHVDDGQKSVQLGLQNLDEVNRLNSSSSDMKNYFGAKLDSCSLNTSETLKVMQDVKAATQELMKKGHGQGPATSLQNIDQHSLDELKKLSSATASMKVAFDEKLNACNQSMKDTQIELNKVSENVNDVKTCTEELVQVARAGEGAKSLRLGKQNLQEITKLCTHSTEMKESFDKKIDMCDKSMISLKNDIGDAMKDLQDVEKDISDTKGQMNEVKNFVSKLTEDLNSQNKIQRLEWALSSITSVVENFQFKGGSTKTLEKPMDSHALIKKVLMAFREGVGLYLPEGVKMDNKVILEEATESKKQEFRDKISSQIKLLTGFKPTITKKGDGRYSIFLP